MIRAALSRTPAKVLLIPILLYCIRADAQTSAPAATAAALATPTSKAAATTALQATTAPAQSATARSYSLAELADTAESTTATLKRINADLGADNLVDSDNRLAVLSREIAARLDEGEKRMGPTASLEALRTLERDWTEVRAELSEWLSDLASRIAALQRDDQRLADSAAAWQRTLEDVGDSNGAEQEEIRVRIRGLTAQIATTRSRIASRIAQVRSLQGRVAAQDVHVADALAAVREAQSRAVRRLLERDSEPVWTGRLGTGAQPDVAEDGRNSLARQWTATWTYATRNGYRFAGHAALIVIFALLAIRIRRVWAVKLGQSGGAMAHSATIFHVPIASALVATLPLMRWFYPQAPRLLLTVLFGAMLVPTILVLRRLALRPLIPLLYSLGVFYVLGLVVNLADSVPALSRSLFLLTMAAGAALLAHFLWRTPREPNYAEFARTAYWKVIQLAVRVALIIMTASAIANILGFVALARLLGDGVLSSAYIAIMLDATVRVVHGLLAVALNTRPVNSLGIVHRHGQLLLRRTVSIIVFLTTIWWASLTLNAFSIRRSVLETATAILTAHWGIGAVNLSLSGLLYFSAAIAGSFLLSRFVRFILAEDVYPRVHLARGVPYAISTLLHYVILFVGFLVAVAMLGYDMTKFTILAGAFGVGLGFGMQNIVNNFVSGLILLFERPIQVGDVIELDPNTVGVVSRIGIRASVVRTGEAADVIVPNGLLIANRVTNWTLSNRQRAFDLPVSVGAGTEPTVVIDLLMRTAQQTECIAKTPAPQAYVTEFLPGGGLKFELRVWTDRFDDWLQARSNLVSAVHAALSKQAIPRV